MLIFNDDSEIDFYEVCVLDENNYMIIGIQEDGVVWNSRYTINRELLVKNESLSISYTQ